MATENVAPISPATTATVTIPEALLEKNRERVFRAMAIIEVAREALNPGSGVPDFANALEAARDLLGEAVSDLDPTAIGD